MNQNSMYRYWGAGERSARYSKKRKIPRGRNRSENIGLPFVKTDEISGLAAGSAGSDVVRASTGAKNAIMPHSIGRPERLLHPTLDLRGNLFTFGYTDRFDCASSG